MSAANLPSPDFSATAYDGVQGETAIPAGHVVQFYSDDAFLVDELSKYIGSALGAGDGAIVIATRAHRDGIAQRLRARGMDPARAMAQGRYIALDAAETMSKFVLNDFPDATRFTDVVGSVVVQATACAEGKTPHVVAFGEMVALLWAQGKFEASLHLEELWNGLAHTHSFSLRCAYPMHAFGREEHGESFLRICAVHSEVIPGENYTALSNDDDRSRTVASMQQKAQALATEIAERRRVEEELRQSKAGLEFLVEQRTLALRRLSARLLTLQDSERRRIARELHDRLGQCLIGLKLNIDMLKHSPEREQLWVEVEALMQQSIAEVRTLSYLLHPPTMDAAGLPSAAHWFVEGFGQRSGIAVNLDVDKRLPRMPDTIELTLFRVMQEALTNVHRHSGSSTANIAIRKTDGQIILEVKDRGCGIKPDVLARAKETGDGLGIGLTGMCERVRDLGGVLHIDSDSSGTAVTVTIPLTSGCGGLKDRKLDMRHKKHRQTGARGVWHCAHWRSSDLAASSCLGRL
jgi:signal transduction histidine kinase